MNKIVNSLIKQLEGQMNSAGVGGMPRGFKVKISTGNPQIRQVIREQSQEVNKKEVEKLPQVSQKESEERAGLPKIEAKSKVRRLADSIIYEINAPGVHAKKDVIITELASGLEIKAYSKDRCYVKIIPLRVEVVEYYVEKDRVFVELKG